MTQLTTREGLSAYEEERGSAGVRRASRWLAYDMSDIYL
jgi:hypothetical protein